jgi:hypothetical protein
MNQMSADLMAILDRMETLLRRIENSQSGASFEPFNMSQLALSVRRECNRSFPVQYFSVDIWDILLELYEAQKTGKRVKISTSESEFSGIPPNLLRYIDMLIADEFLYLEHVGVDDEAGYACLTQKGLDQLEEIFRKSKKTLGTQYMTLDILKPQRATEAK